MLEIKLTGDDVLRQPAREIEEITDDIVDLAHNMIETMRLANGIGLAAPQIGLSLAMVVIDLTDMTEDDPNDPSSELAEGPMVFINPRVLHAEGECTYEEGCLSIPNVFAEVKRPAWVTVEFIDLDGDTYELQADGLLARVLQHEIDHLHGVLFTDYLDEKTRERAMKKLDLEAYDDIYITMGIAV